MYVCTYADTWSKYLMNLSGAIWTYAHTHALLASMKWKISSSSDKILLLFLLPTCACGYALHPYVHRSTDKMAPFLRSLLVGGESIQFMWATPYTGTCAWGHACNAASLLTHMHTQNGTFPQITKIAGSAWFNSCEQLTGNMWPELCMHCILFQLTSQDFSELFSMWVAKSAL